MSQHSYNLGSKGKWHSIDISHYYRAAEKQSPSAGVWEWLLSIWKPTGCTLPKQHCFVRTHSSLPFPFPCTAKWFPECCSKRCEQHSRSTVSHIHTPCFLSQKATRALWTLGEWWIPSPALQASGSPVSPYTSGSWEMGKTPFLHKWTVLLAEGQADPSRAGVSFLGQIFLLFLLFSVGKLSCMHI